MRRTDVQVRPFAEGDYERMAAIGAAAEPLRTFTVEVLRHRDATVEPRIKRVRLVAETPSAGVIGWGQVQHIWWAFHPRRFQMQLQVDPAWQRRGVGSALFDRLIDQLQAWHAELVRAEAAVSQPDAVRFLEHRGFSEWRRRWASFLEVASANLQPLLDAEWQVTAAGVAMTTYADEQARRGDHLARELYEAELRMAEDEPGTEPNTEPMSFERYVSAELETPAVLPQAHFLALDGDRIVGVSRLERDLSEADLLQQAFTGTVPEYRGRRIAQALKLRTIQFARDHGYRRIRTNNDSANEAMLHINDRIGFKRETPVVILMRRF